MNKKYYLSIQQRDRIVNDLLSEKTALNVELKAKPQSPRVHEMAEEANQERDMLVALFRVEENERT